MRTTVTYPEGHVLLRNLHRNYPVISHGQGVYLYDSKGKRYLDAAGGALVMSCGHGIAEIADSIAAQLKKVGYVNGTQFTSEVMENFADRLAAKAKPLGLDRVAILGSGSEAMEAAVKFARQIWVERGEPERGTFIARVPGYHGNTFYALSASGRPHYKKLFGPLLSKVATVSAPYGYRCPVDYETQGAAHYAKELETLIEKEGPKTIAGFLVETISGSSTGGWTPPPGYYEQMTAVCKKYGILVIADEVLCGAGRTGKFFAAEHYGLKPDIAVLGKGINSGYMPVSAVLVRQSDVDLIKKGTGYFLHAQTYLQSPCMAATGLAVLDYMDKHGLVENSATTGAYLHDRLQKRISGLPGVGCTAGRGLLAGVEFVKDKGTKQPFDRSAKMVEGFLAIAFEKGLTLWPNIGQADGVNGDLVVMGPPLSLTKPQADEIVDLLEQSIHAFFAKGV
ncbi:aminotransferase class III-fold pyridoxal phosphate-dependent enzyme [bacterium]|nr:aminotransferase class III-fold pyridoxal phosphate-dependent enzyme [bacterium]